MHVGMPRPRYGRNTVAKTESDRFLPVPLLHQSREAGPRRMANALSPAAFRMKVVVLFRAVPSAQCGSVCCQDVAKKRLPAANSS